MEGSSLEPPAFASHAPARHPLHPGPDSDGGRIAQIPQSPIGNRPIPVIRPYVGITYRWYRARH